MKAPLRAIADVPCFTLSFSQIAAIRRALLIGLDSYGEIERLSNHVQLMNLGKEEIPDELRPIHPTGCSDTIGEFATALRHIEISQTA